MNDPDYTITLLEELRATGVRLAVDDFGTGYSSLSLSLSYLRRLPIHEVKIERSFITHLTRDGDDQFIVSSIIHLAARLSLHVTAEGVEDQDSWNRLAELGCTAIQGYHLAAPMPPEAFPQWLKDYDIRLRSDHPAKKSGNAPHLKVV